MNWISFAGIGIGAALGAWARWLLGLWLNPIFTAIPLGTLAANLIGGYLIGVGVMAFHLNASLPLEVRLFCITGFLGGLTTFSTFSAEVVALIRADAWMMALAAAGVHVIGSLLMTGLGIYTVQRLAQ
ncbi:MAG TPA: fluoride efflux transporter CrcB [Rhodocyclaceae bacterium]|jgi:CrcB protein|nr:fluoride efflux transporter CrcB [Rhodocyclaceae bacterium]